MIGKMERRGRKGRLERPQKSRHSLAFCETNAQAGKSREGRVAMIFWVSRETVMTWPMRRRM
jgi:hypothetical protein